jgi:hypothetical protein
MIGMTPRAKNLMDLLMASAKNDQEENLKKNPGGWLPPNFASGAISGPLGQLAGLSGLQQITAPPASTFDVISTPNNWIRNTQQVTATSHSHWHATPFVLMSDSNLNKPLEINGTVRETFTQKTTTNINTGRIDGAILDRQEIEFDGYVGDTPQGKVRARKRHQ